VERHPEIEFVGLNVADQDERARDFVEANGWDWPQLIDRDRTRAKRLGADYQPAFFAIDEDGRIVGSHIGYGDPENPDAWEALADKLL
jgi:Redoxin